MMTSKERMLTALSGGVPDRLPATIHQWQRYHLHKHMNGMDALEAFRAVELDASHTPWGLVHQQPSPAWRIETQDLGLNRNARAFRITIHTPDGDLTQTSEQDPFTTYTVDHPLRSAGDVELLLRHLPPSQLDRDALAREYDRLGDDGIVRGFVCHERQPGPWQEFCELAGTQQAIYWAHDDPAFVHHFLAEMTRRKVHYIHDQMHGAKYDLIEHGGGAASANVISPAMFDAFCVPYDRQIIAALHEEGFPVVYHTCGHMLPLLDHIPANGCDASETLSPPGVGGDIATTEQRQRVKQTLGSKVRLIGGLDQSNLDQPNSPAIEAAITRDVQDCFNTFGRAGAYICSAADHFFEAPPANLLTFARAARDCTY